MSLSPSIAAKLQAEIKSTFAAIVANPSCGKTMLSVQTKYIAEAQKYFETSHPKAVAKRLAKNSVNSIIKRSMGYNY
jgi:hypothetical protein